MISTSFKKFCIFAKRLYFDFISNKVLFFTTLGISFGFMFPIIAISLMLNYYKLPFSIDTILELHEMNYLLHMIDTAPLFLGFFAYQIGCAQAKLYKQLYYDSTTGLLNRYSLAMKCREIKNIHDIESKGVSLTIINMSNYSRISHMRMDFITETLITVSKMLQSICMDNEILFRLANGEFLIVKIGSNVDELPIRINELFSKPIQILQYTYKITMNIGVAKCDDLGSDYQIILDRAYIAMNKHKLNKRLGYVLFNDSFYNNFNDLKLETDLYQAIKNNELYLQYQPIVHIKTGKIKGAEALIRWKSPTLGFVPPSEFVHILESSNLITVVGLWIAKESFIQTKKIHDLGYKDFYISINISVVQLYDSSFVEKLNQIVSEVGIDKKSIKLEITESVTTSNRNFVRDILLDLYNNGYSLSIDDFGTGYSSLSELELMPLDNLKIDKSFIDRYSCTNTRNHTIEAIVRMALGLKLHVIVEGVETKEQYEYLAKLECDYIQGYYFSKPIFSEQLLELLEKENVNG